MGRLFAASYLVALSLSLAVAAENPIRVADRLMLGDRLALDGGFDRGKWDEDLRARSRTCQLPGGRMVEAISDPGRHNVYRVEIREQGVVENEILPEPQTLLEGAPAAFPINLACDLEIERVYFAASVDGWVSASTTEGKELWRVQLPSFDHASVTQGQPTPADWDFLGEEFTFVMQIVPSGPYLLVEYRHSVNPDQVWQLVVHRSGAVIGAIGPSDRFFGRVGGEAHWRLFGGGANEGERWKVPDHTIDLSVIGNDEQSLVEHAIALLAPKPTDKSYTFRLCEMVGNDDVRRIMGDSFNESSYARARKALQRLGSTGYQKFVEEHGLWAILRAYQPGSRDWYSRFRKALLDAGFDVLIVAQHDGD